MEFNKQNILNKVKEAKQTKVVMDEGLKYSIIARHEPSSLAPPL